MVGERGRREGGWEGEGREGGRGRREEGWDGEKGGRVGGRVGGGEGEEGEGVKESENTTHH